MIAESRAQIGDNWDERDDFTEGLDCWETVGDIEIVERDTETGSVMRLTDETRSRANWTCAGTFNTHDQVEFRGVYRINDSRFQHRFRLPGDDHDLYLLINPSQGNIYFASSSLDGPGDQTIDSALVDTWAEFRLSLDGEGSVRAKVWEHGTEEPPDWQLSRSIEPFDFEFRAGVGGNDHDREMLVDWVEVDTDPQEGTADSVTFDWESGETEGWDRFEVRDGQLYQYGFDSHVFDYDVVADDPITGTYSPRIETLNDRVYVRSPNFSDILGASPEYLSWVVRIEGDLDASDWNNHNFRLVDEEGEWFGRIRFDHEHMDVRWRGDETVQLEPFEPEEPVSIQVEIGEDTVTVWVDGTSYEGLKPVDGQSLDAHTVEIRAMTSGGTSSAQYDDTIELRWDDFFARAEAAETEPPSTPPDSDTGDDIDTRDSDYDFEDAGLETEVELAGETYYVLQAIPDADDINQRAVVTTEYELVDLATAHEVLVVEEGMERPRGFDWEAALDRAESQRIRWRATEVLNRAADVGWGGLATFGMAKINPKGALPLALDTLQSSVGWVINEIDSPYKETLSKMSEWTYTYEEQTLEFETTTRLSDISDDIFEFASVGLEAYQAIESYDQAYDALTTAAENSDAFTSSLEAGTGAAGITTFHYAKGKLISETVDTVRTGFQQNAELAAIATAFHTARIPIIERIIELQDQADAGELDPANAIELQYLISRHHLMGAYAKAGMAEQARALSESRVGSGWDVLVNVDDVIPVLEDRSEVFLEGSSKAQVDLGEWLQLVDERRDESLNAVLEGGEGA